MSTAEITAESTAFSEVRSWIRENPKWTKIAAVGTGVLAMLFVGSSLVVNALILAMITGISVWILAKRALKYQVGRRVVAFIKRHAFFVDATVTATILIVGFSMGITMALGCALMGLGVSLGIDFVPQSD